MNKAILIIGLILLVGCNLELNGDSGYIPEELIFGSTEFSMSVTLPCNNISIYFVGNKIFNTTGTKVCELLNTQDTDKSKVV